MQLHEIIPIHKGKAAKRIGRGGVHGFQSGKGAKGQRSRASRKFKPVIRELVKRYAKLRGYRFQSSAEKPRVLNLGIFDKKFEKGETVSPKILLEKKIIRTEGGIIPQIKILSGGEIKTALIFEKCLLSESAKKKIMQAGGEVK